jgi:hypothetical protein
MDVYLKVHISSASRRYASIVALCVRLQAVCTQRYSLRSLCLYSSVFCSPLVKHEASIAHSFQSAKETSSVRPTVTLVLTSEFARCGSFGSMLATLLSNGTKPFRSTLEKTNLCQGASVALAVFACWLLSRVFHKVSIRALYEAVSSEVYFTESLKRKRSHGMSFRCLSASL